MTAPRRDGPGSPATRSLPSLLLPLALLLAACTTAPEPSGGTPESPTAVETSPPVPASPTPQTLVPPARVSGPPETLAAGLEAPWSVLRLDDGGVLVSERDAARILELGPGGETTLVREVPGVVPFGEGGLLGLAALEGAGERWVYAALSAEEENRIVRMALSGAPGGYALGEPVPVLNGIPRASNHNGGRIAFGPDGMLYATAGDAGDGANAQDPASLGGKILRMTPTGGVPPDAASGSIVHSLGHRNPQGLAWDSLGRLWAAEFGQNTWDELNLVRAGANYGWPVVEGVAGDPRFVDPVAQWPTSEASPSGLAIVSDTLFLASLRGERLWRIRPDAAGVVAELEPLLIGELGRLRDAVPGPDGSLWLLTNNTDGRGEPRDGDDRLVRLPLTAG